MVDHGGTRTAPESAQTGSDGVALWHHKQSQDQIQGKISRFTKFFYGLVCGQGWFGARHTLEFRLEQVRIPNRGRQFGKRSGHVPSSLLLTASMKARRVFRVLVQEGVTPPAHQPDAPARATRTLARASGWYDPRPTSKAVARTAVKLNHACFASSAACPHPPLLIAHHNVTPKRWVRLVNFAFRAHPIPRRFEFVSHPSRARQSGLRLPQRSQVPAKLSGPSKSAS